MARRGVADEAAGRRFLAPALDDLHDPRALHGMTAAVERLLAARSHGQRVALVGDYDVDGITGTALLSACFEAGGLSVVRMIPDRMREGYGFQPVHADRAKAQDCSLVVTVDCGTTSFAAIERALELGIETIVTDHHLPSGSLPEGVVLINPKQAACSYPCPDLSGAGLAFKLSVAFLEALGRQPPLSSLLRVACLGTIADLVPLRGENRVIATLGLRELPLARAEGLQALMRVAGTRAPLRSDDVGYRLAPRLNAAGRLANAERALELLLTRDATLADEIALELERHNQERQLEERRVVEEATERFVGLEELPGVLVAWSHEWHRGVVGIAAGRLATSFHRPTLLLAVDGDVATGSGRGIHGVHLFDFLEPWRDRLLAFGGHAAAIGLSAPVAALPTLAAEWQDAARWSEEVLTKRYEYEIELWSAGELDLDLFREIARLEPYGMGNPAPLVCLRGVRLFGEPRQFGKGHLSGILHSEDATRARFVGWNWSERRARMTGPIDVLGHVAWDDYLGVPSLRLVDARAQTSD
jgi:single-stranded-DNA-specific exonuclease